MNCCTMEPYKKERIQSTQKYRHCFQRKISLETMVFLLTKEFLRYIVSYISS